MQVLDKPSLLNPIGSYSEGFQGTLTEYSFSKIKTEFVRDLSDLPFPLGAILHSEIPDQNRSVITSDIAYLAERVIGEWLNKYAEYSFQPEATYVYQSASKRDMRITAPANDFTILGEGSIVNVEVKYIANGGASRRTHRFRKGTEQLKATSEMISILSKQQDPKSAPIKPKNVMIVIRKKPSDNQDSGDGKVSRSQRIYNNLLTAAGSGAEDSHIPRIILSYQDLTKIFKSLYPKHQPSKEFEMTAECMAEVRTFIAKNN